METLRQVGGSLILAALSAALVIGGISLALAESYVPKIPTPTETQAQNFPAANTPTLQALVFVTQTPPALSETVSPPTSCPPPTGWIPITVQPGDDLMVLSLRHQSSPEELSSVNCLFSTDLPTGSIIYVPSLPTQTVAPCGPPTGWVMYTVQSGDTLYSISHAYDISVPQLQYSNCIPSNQYNISVGQILWVPNISITRTPLATATITLTPVSIIFPTLTYTPTSTQTATITATTTSTPTQTATIASPTGTPTATATETAVPTETSIP